MKGLQPIFLGIFGIFAFSWLGMTVVPNLQIGGLNPQTDEDGTDIYPQPPSGMALRGARVYAANGCVYCHSQQVRPEYGGSDIERKWGTRRSAPRDYIFEPIVFLGKMRTGPDLANIGARSMSEASPSPSPTGSPAASPAIASASPGAGASPAAANASAASPAPAGSSATASAAAPAPNGSPAAAGSPAAVAAASPAASPAAGAQAAASPSAAAMVANPEALTQGGSPKPYTAAWQHRHLYNPRSVVPGSIMPSYRFLYVKRRASGEASGDAINFDGDEDEAPKEGWEIVPSYDAKCLVAYLMSLNQTHPLKEAKSAVVSAAAPKKEEAAK